MRSKAAAVWIKKAYIVISAILSTISLLLAVAIFLHFEDLLIWGITAVFFAVISLLADLWIGVDIWKTTNRRM